MWLLCWICLGLKFRVRLGIVSDSFSILTRCRGISLIGTMSGMTRNYREKFRISFLNYFLGSSPLRFLLRYTHLRWFRTPRWRPIASSSRLYQSTGLKEKKNFLVVDWAEVRSLLSRPGDERRPQFYTHAEMNGNAWFLWACTVYLKREKFAEMFNFFFAIFFSPFFFFCRVAVLFQGQGGLIKDALFSFCDIMYLFSTV